MWGWFVRAGPGPALPPPRSQKHPQNICRNVCFGVPASPRPGSPTPRPPPAAALQSWRKSSLQLPSPLHEPGAWQQLPLGSHEYTACEIWFLSAAPPLSPPLPGIIFSCNCQVSMRCCPPGIPRSKRSAPLRTSWGEEEGAEGCGIHPAEAPPTANRDQHVVPMGMVTRTGL